MCYTALRRQTVTVKKSGLFFKITLFLLLQNGVHSWSPPDGFPTPFPCPLNPILCHVAYRLQDIVDPPKPPPTPPSFPQFMFRASIMGRPFAGKSTVLERLEQGKRTFSLSLSRLSLSLSLSLPLSLSLSLPLPPGVLMGWLCVPDQPHSNACISTHGNWKVLTSRLRGLLHCKSHDIVTVRLLLPQ